MTKANLKNYRLGWVGTGRMGYAMAARLLKNGCDVAVYNRTRAKAQPSDRIWRRHCRFAGRPGRSRYRFHHGDGTRRSDRSGDWEQGHLSRSNYAPKLLVDCSSVSTEASAAVREQAAARGVAMLAAPVSGNAKVVKAGLLSVVASGPEAQSRLPNPTSPSSAGCLSRGDLAAMCDRSVHARQFTLGDR